MSRFEAWLRWAAAPFIGGYLTVEELEYHIDRLDRRRRRLTHEALTISTEIVHWNKELHSHSTEKEKP
jgi:hypothetical protein